MLLSDIVFTHRWEEKHKLKQVTSFTILLTSFLSLSSYSVTRCKDYDVVKVAKGIVKLQKVLIPPLIP
jgi:hypothetical protein